MSAVRTGAGFVPTDPQHVATKAYVDGRTTTPSVQTANSGATANQWTRIATASVAAQYAESSAIIELVSNGDGDTVSSVIRLRWRVKQQAAFGSQPILETAVIQANGAQLPVNLLSVVTSNAGPTTADLYVQIATTYRQFTVQAQEIVGTLSLVSNTTISTTTPTGSLTQYGYWSMTGPGYVPAQATDLTPKSYVDGRTPKITVSTTAPASPAVGDLWVDTN